MRHWPLSSVVAGEVRRPPREPFSRPVHAPDLKGFTRECACFEITGADQLPLELGQRREDAEHEAAGRGGGVDLRTLVGEHPQAHAAGRQVLHQMGEVAAQAVELPDDEHVALPQSAQAAVESPRPVVADAGGEVVVEVDRVNAGRLQGVALRVQRLGAVDLQGRLLGESAEHTHEGDLVREAQLIVGGPPQGDLAAVGFEEGGIADQAGAGDVGVGDRHASPSSSTRGSTTSASTTSSRRPPPDRRPRSVGGSTS